MNPPFAKLEIMESTRSSEKVLICETCGDKGFTNAFIYCVSCLGSVIHRYCLYVMPRTSDEFVPWLCADCKPAVPSQCTLPEVKPSRSQKQDAARSGHVEKTRPKKKKKKQKRVTTSVARKAKVKFEEETTEPDRKCIPQTGSPLKEASTKSNSSPKRITPCVVAGTEEGASEKQASVFSRLDDNCASMKKCTKRKRNAARLAAKRKKRRLKKSLNHIDQKASAKVVDSIDNFRSDSSHMTETSKSKKGSVEEQRHESQLSPHHCEIDKKPDVTEHEKLHSDSSSAKKESNTKITDQVCQAEAKNQTQNKQDINSSRAGNVVSQSVDFANKAHENHYQVARPFLDPVWRGSFKILHTDYDLLEGFVAHLSTEACYKVCEEASMLPSLLCLEMHPKTVLWPKSFLESEPTGENIALYFFPGDAKNERAFDHLVMDMMDEELAMRATAKNAELLMFTSSVLPRSHWRFHGKYYLWGVFRGKRKDTPTPVNHNRPVSNNSTNSGLSEHSPNNEVTSGKKIPNRVKTLDARSPQSPLCNIGVRGVDMGPESGY